MTLALATTLTIIIFSVIGFVFIWMCLMAVHDVARNARQNTEREDAETPRFVIIPVMNNANHSEVK